MGCIGCVLAGKPHRHNEIPCHHGWHVSTHFAAMGESASVNFITELHFCSQL